MVIPALYIHIPFCYRLCHYCDFAKTARYDEVMVRGYFDALRYHLQTTLGALHEAGVSPKFETVFLGGGTPSIFAMEYQALFQDMAPFLAENCEISLESNPEDLRPDRLEVWRSLGINRISVGVQSFDPQGLNYLSRTHDPIHCRQALALAQRYFDNLNVDLIYGWPGQSDRSWANDLAICLDLQIAHLSLYNLTYEPGTVLGRRMSRGVIETMPEAKQLHLYEFARQALGGYEHEEVSNWSKPGFSCRHNWAYWTDQFYLAIGTGAHGYIPDMTTPFGLRYFHPKNKVRLQSNLKDKVRGLPLTLEALGYQLDKRQRGDWLLEVIAGGIRTSRGIDVSALQRQASFVPSKRIQEAIAAGIIKWELEGQFLRLDPSEWVREIYWATELSASFL